MASLRHIRAARIAALVCGDVSKERKGDLSVNPALQTHTTANVAAASLRSPRERPERGNHGTNMPAWSPWRPRDRGLIHIRRGTGEGLARFHHSYSCPDSP